MSQVVTCPRCQLLIVNGQHELLTPQDGLRFIVMHYKVEPAFIKWVPKFVLFHGIDPRKSE